MTTTNPATPPQGEPIPDLRGRSNTEAFIAAAAAGYTITYTGENSEPATTPATTVRWRTPWGSVTGQQPPPGHTAERGSTITVTTDYNAPGKTVAATAAILAVLAVFAYFYIVKGEQTSHTIIIPNVIGSDIATATSNLEADTLTLATPTLTIDNHRIPGTVTAQTPAPGTHVDEHTQVSLTITTPSTNTIPTTIGQTTGEAKKTLHNSGYLLNPDTSTTNSPQPADTIITQTPAPGTQALRGTTITVTTSNGRNTVPSVIGQTRTQATTALHNAGFSAAIHTTPTPLVAAGTVIAQHIPAGTTANHGTTITLTISETPPTPTPRPTPTDTPTLIPTTPHP